MESAGRKHFGQKHTQLLLKSLTFKAYLYIKKPMFIQQRYYKKSKLIKTNTILNLLSKSKPLYDITEATDQGAKLTSLVHDCWLPEAGEGWPAWKPESTQRRTGLSSAYEPYREQSVAFQRG